MEYPKLKSPAVSRETITTFLGYSHKERVPNGAFYNMQNMTSDHYPALSARPGRQLFFSGERLSGILAKDGVCHVDGEDFYINGEKVSGLTLRRDCDICPRKEICAGFAPGKTYCEKSLLSMGSYVLIFPDKKWVQRVKTPAGYLFGDMENVWKSQGQDVTASLCQPDGADYENVPHKKPESPQDGDLWMDKDTPALMRWSEQNAAWVKVTPTYVRIQSPGLGANFSKYDGVTISGLMGKADVLNKTSVVFQTTQDSVVVEGLVTIPWTSSQEVTVARAVPEADFATVCDNRLWLCRYGKNQAGEFVNQIYCSKLGDFKNFSCFMGLPTDSGALAVGSDGPFTGAVTHLDHPLFFKEDMLHKVYVSDTGAHGVSHTPCRGVQSGCGKSLAIVGERLYYKSPSGVCAYDGSLPSEISQDLGVTGYASAVAGACGSKYYISMERNGERSLFVYDTEKRMWHREDDLPVLAFCAAGQGLYAMTPAEIVQLTGVEESRESVRWWAQTGDMELLSPDMKYLLRLSARMALRAGAKVSFSVSYDRSQQWEHIATVTGNGLRSFTFPIRPRRCDTVALRLEGEGDVKIHSLTKTVLQGSDIP